ncbi:MAG TPA: hypothetical protein PKN33_02490 [Phycisphaerae bacterium]|nr:hypothetical protein [Phycisphaerae bacterium]
MPDTNVFKRLRVASLLVCATVFCIAVPARAQLRDKLPKDAIVYVELSGSEHTLEGRLTTPFGRLMNDPGMKAFKDSAWEAIGKLIAKEAKSEEDAKVAKAVTDVLTHLWKQGFALSLGNIEMGQQGPDFSLAVVSPAGGDSAAFVEGITFLLKQPDVPPSSPVEVDGAALNRFMLPTPMPIPAHYGVVDKTFIFTIGGSAPSKVIAAMTGKSPSLAANEALADASKVIGLEKAYVNAVLHVDIQAALTQSKAIFEAMGQPDFPPMFKVVIDGLGLTSCNTVTVGSHFDNGGYKSSVYVSTSKERTGLFKLADQKPLTDDDLKWIPKSANFAYAFNHDHVKAYDDVITVLNSLPMVGVFAHQGIQKVEQKIGLSIRDDILAQLGDNVIYFDSPDAGGTWFTGITAVIEVKDQAKLEALIERALGAVMRAMNEETPEPITHRIRTTDFDGYKVKYVQVPGLPIPVAVSWCFHEDRLVAGLMPQSVRFAVNRVVKKNVESTSILSNEDFRRGRKQYPEEVIALGYVNTKAGIADIYPLIALGVTALGNFSPELDVDWDFATFPTHETFVADTFGDVSAMWTDDNGVHMTGHGPWPIPVGPSAHAQAAVAAVSFSVMLPSLARAREMAKRAVSAANLRNLGVGCAVYANDHDGKFPPDLKTLVDEGIVDVKTLYHLDSDQTECSYKYIAGHTDSYNANWVVAYESFNGQSPEGANVLFGDSHVEFVKPLFKVQELVDKTMREMNKPATP